MDIVLYKFHAKVHRTSQENVLRVKKCQPGLKWKFILQIPATVELRVPNHTLINRCTVYVIVFFSHALHVQAGKHEAIVKNVHDLLAKLAWDFSPEQLDHLFDCFKVSLNNLPFIKC